MGPARLAARGAEDRIQRRRHRLHLCQPDLNDQPCHSLSSMVQGFVNSAAELGSAHYAVRAGAPELSQDACNEGNLSWSTLRGQGAERTLVGVLK